MAQVGHNKKIPLKPVTSLIGQTILYEIHPQSIFTSRIRRWLVGCAVSTRDSPSCVLRPGQRASYRKASYTAPMRYPDDDDDDNHHPPLHRGSGGSPMGPYFQGDEPSSLAGPELVPKKDVEEHTELGRSIPSSCFPRWYKTVLLQLKSPLITVDFRLCCLAQSSFLSRHA